MLFCTNQMVSLAGTQSIYIRWGLVRTRSPSCPSFPSTYISSNSYFSPTSSKLATISAAHSAKLTSLIFHTECTRTAARISTCPPKGGASISALQCRRRIPQSSPPVILAKRPMWRLFLLVALVSWILRPTPR